MSCCHSFMLDSHGVLYDDDDDDDDPPAALPRFIVSLYAKWDAIPNSATWCIDDVRICTSTD